MTLTPNFKGYELQPSLYTYLGPGLVTIYVPLISSDLWYGNVNFNWNNVCHQRLEQACIPLGNDFYHDAMLKFMNASYRNESVDFFEEKKLVATQITPRTKIMLSITNSNVMIHSLVVMVWKSKVINANTLTYSATVFVSLTIKWRLGTLYKQ